jgi:23S rRNA pseudouridine1911/1915/1917 synthase
MDAREFTIDTTLEGLRLDKALVQLCPDLSRAYLQQLIRSGYVIVNEMEPKANQKLKLGDDLSVALPEQIALDVKAVPMDLDILYEDHDVLVLNKPKGLVVHPGAGTLEPTLVSGLLAHCTDLSGINGVLRPGIVHRIDKDTSGCLIVAKNDQAHRHLADQLLDKRLNRVYWALVHGVILHNTGTIEAPIGRDPKDRQKMCVTNVNAKPALTHFRVLKRYTHHSLIECRLETGRTHQIRVHLNYIQHPVVGDPKYGPAHNARPDGQLLHAHTIGFIHPSTRESLSFSAPLPPAFQTTLDQLEEIA